MSGDLLLRLRLLQPRNSGYAALADEAAAEIERLTVLVELMKWQPIASMLGLHTSYELSRIGGRYRTIGQERSETRTVHSLEAAKHERAYR